MLGKLRTYLRMCGYDAAYALERDVEADARLQAIAIEEARTLLTRDRSLAADTEDSLLLETRDVRDQLRELAAAGFDLRLPEEPSRCGQCNGRLQALPATASTPERVPNPAEKRVWQCEDCGQHFWKGSHWDDVAEALEEIG